MGARAVVCRSIKRHQEWFQTDAKLAGVGLEIMSIILNSAVGIGKLGKLGLKN